MKEESILRFNPDVFSVFFDKCSLSAIKDQFIKKLPAMILVYAEVEEKQGIEYFHYNRACLLANITNNALVNAFKEEHVVIDLRLHDKGTSARNHGTGFRIKEYIIKGFYYKATRKYAPI